MKTYIGTKIIQAEPMDAFAFSTAVRPLPEPVVIKTNGKSAEGYKVVYPDGYVSWSPKNVFEAAYREITLEEQSLLKGNKP